MTKPDSSDSERPLSDRRFSDRALILPLVGLLLLLPPLAGLFQLDIRVFGIPFTGLYLFAVWGALIAGAAMLARRLQNSASWDSAESESGSSEADSNE